jgi:hypothetical protein
MKEKKRNASDQFLIIVVVACSKIKETHELEGEIIRALKPTTIDQMQQTIAQQ